LPNYHFCSVAVDIHDTSFGSPLGKSMLLAGNMAAVTTRVIGAAISCGAASLLIKNGRRQRREHDR
jgi:hypothetical protein